jgi:hypothetical protein
MPLVNIEFGNIATITSEFGTFTIARNPSSFSVIGPDTFSSEFQFLANVTGNLANIGNVGEVSSSISSEFEYAISYQNAAASVSAKIKELSDAQLNSNVALIHSDFVSLNSNVALIHGTQIVISKDIQDIRDRASNEDYGIVTVSSNSDIYALDRAATINALRKSGELADVEAEMTDPTPLPYDSSHYSNIGNIVSSGGTVSSYDDYS